MTMAKAKRKPKQTKKQQKEQAKQIAEFAGYIVTEKVVKTEIECISCSRHFLTDDYDIDAEEEAKAMAATCAHQNGWRIIDSAKLGIKDIMCPKCVSMPDSQRGGYDEDEYDD
jgi:ectoine hydroxylase-related dioxygenase (phytanoyl-CoA dioxygenase family)